MNRPPLVLVSALGRVRRRLAWLAAERGAARGLFAGLTLACAVLLARDHLALTTTPLATLALVALPSALASALVAALLAWRGPATPAGAARAADRDLGLSDRLATALELARASRRGVFAEACIIDAARAAATVDARRVGRREWPREARLVPVVGLLALVMALLPPVRLDRALDALAALVGTSGSQAQPPAGDGPLPEPRRQAELAVKEALRREAAQGPLPRSSESLRLSAVFKDTKLSSIRPDSNAFLGTDDERLKLFRQPGALPDLRQQPSHGGYQLKLRRMQEMMGALGNGGISKKQFAELTERLKQMGRERGNRGGAFDRALKDGMSAFDAGDTSEAYDSMRRALDALGGEDGAGADTALPPSGEGGGEWPEDLAGFQGHPRGEDGRDGSSGSSSGQGEEGDAGSRGTEAGKGGRGKKRPGGADTPEWASRNDSFVEGMMSAGHSEAYDSDVQGRGGGGVSRLPYMNVFNEYRRQVEETLVKEAVPLEAREQVRAYFRSLED